jgi:peptidoglycan/LPS O-acetylase OafA/YrhL
MTSAELVRPHTRRPSLPSLTGLRFVAALLVFGFHLDVFGIFRPGAAATVLGKLFGPGAVGVSFFFVLSGFVLAWSARPGDTARGFLRRRFARVYPNHLATAVVAIGIAAVTGVGLSLPVIVPNLLLLQAWSPDPKVYFGLNTVSWSLSCEAFFYAAFPLLHRVLRRLPARALWPGVALALGTVWLIPLLTLPLSGAHRYWAIWVFPLARLPEFVAGMLLARVVREGRWPAVDWRAVAALAVAAYLLAPHLPADLRLVAGTVVPLALLVPAVAATDLAGRRTALSTPTAVRLGELSYAFYLVHELVLRALARATGTGHGQLVALALSALALAVAVLASAVLRRTVELPAMRLITGTRRRAVRPPLAGQVATAGKIGRHRTPPRDDAVPAEPGGR